MTGGAGFIGSNYILEWFATNDEPVVNLDKLTYAGNLQNLASLEAHPSYHFIHGDIGDNHLVLELLTKYKPRAIINFAAETHVDRSIKTPENFISTNVSGTFHLLESARIYWQALNEVDQKAFRFVHISTDEVYGSLTSDAAPFTEHSQYAPNSPYSASKAASDHLVRAYHKTYGLPVLTTHCSNNYGPYQYPEKLIPFMILRALNGENLSVYGDGQHIRDWLYVTDHCAAIREVLSRGSIGEVYNIGATVEKTNLEIVHIICSILDKEMPKPDGGSYASQIIFAEDRLGHDRRYAINSEKVQRETGWKPAIHFNDGILKTIRWYLNHREWMHHARLQEKQEA